MRDLSILIPTQDRRGENNPMYGRHHTKEARDKIRKGHLGIKMPPRSDEFRQRMSKIHKGKVVSEETRRRISESRMRKGIPSPRKGVKLTEETKQKLREANLGKICSEETRRKHSENGKGKSPWNKGKKLPHRPRQSFLMSGKGN